MCNYLRFLWKMAPLDVKIRQINTTVQNEIMPILLFVVCYVICLSSL